MFVLAWATASTTVRPVQHLVSDRSDPMNPAIADKSISGAHRTPIETRRKHRMRHGYGAVIQMTSSSVLLICANILLLGANPRLRLLLDDRFHETGLSGTGSLLVDSSFAIG